METLTLLCVRAVKKERRMPATEVGLGEKDYITLIKWKVGKEKSK